MTDVEQLNPREEKAIFHLDRLTSEERLQVFYRYCGHCGLQQPGWNRGGQRCNCWNDE